MLLSCVGLLLVCCLAAGSYPLYGASSKARYSRSMSAWPPMPISMYYPRATRPLYYPQPQVDDYYYPQEPYYYPGSMYPAYYLDTQRPYYYGYDELTEPVDELPEDVEEEERADYGQETWYQQQDQDNADVNARFLQNLILAQMYSDQQPANQKYQLYDDQQTTKSPSYPAEEESGGRWVYGEPVKTYKSKPSAKEDEDVRELKSLVQGPERKERSDRRLRKEKDIFAAQTSQLKSNNWDEYRTNYKRSNNELKFATRKVKVSSTPAPAIAPVGTPQTLALRGQKEVVLPRPANPIRAPDFQKFVSRGVRSHEPSVYDTIKKLLHMEEKLDEGESTGRLQKRSYIPSEESLVAQLGQLKKMA